VTHQIRGHADAQLVEKLRYKPEGRRFDSLRCYWHNSFRLHYGPGVDSASNRNKHQEYFLGSKVGRRWVGLTTLPPSGVDCLEIRES